MSKTLDMLRAQPGFLSMKAPGMEQISHAEEELSLRYAEDYREYIAAMGVATFQGHELTGICNSSRLDVVSVTRRERARNNGIPSDWYVIEQTNIDDIVVWQDASGAVYQTMPGTAAQRICSSLSEYVTR